MNRKRATCSGDSIFHQILLSFVFPSILLFSRRALFRSNECRNLEGERISSRAFSCWAEHESLRLYFQHGIPFGTLLATRLALLSKQIIKLKVSFADHPDWCQFVRARMLRDLQQPQRFVSFFFYARVVDVHWRGNNSVQASFSCDNITHASLLRLHN